MKFLSWSNFCISFTLYEWKNNKQMVCSTNWSPLLQSWVSLNLQLANFIALPKIYFPV